MLMPKRTKYRRPHILKYEGHSKDLLLYGTSLCHEGKRKL